MTNEREMIEWFQEGIDRGASHMLVAYDLYYQKDVSVFVFPEQDYWKEVVRFVKDDGLQVKSVLFLDEDRDSQIKSSIIPDNFYFKNKVLS